MNECRTALCSTAIREKILKKYRVDLSRAVLVHSVCRVLATNIGREDKIMLHSPLGEYMS